MSPTVQYAILLPDDEQAWEQTTAEYKASVYDRHREFSRLLLERGHELVGGAELTPSHTGRIVRGGRGAVTVTDGPYSETVEQLSGFYLVRSNDLDDLLDLCGLIAGDGAVEVRACATGSDADPTEMADTTAGTGSGPGA
jgi:hypothetical protein